MLGALLWGLGAAMAVSEENERAKVSERDDTIADAVQIIRELVENSPDTYSGTDIDLQQKKLFRYQAAVSKAMDFVEENE